MTIRIFPHSSSIPRFLCYALAGAAVFLLLFVLANHGFSEHRAKDMLAGLVVLLAPFAIVAIALGGK